MVKATHADWVKAREDREAWGKVIAKSVAKYVAARNEMKRIEAELDAETEARR